MTRTLFAISEDLLALDHLLEELGGDVSDPAVDAAITAWMTELGADESLKFDGYVNYIRQLEMEAAAAQAEANDYAERAQTRRNRVAWLKSRVKDHLEATGRKKAGTATGRTLAIQANGGMTPILWAETIDIEAVPENLTKRVLDTEAVRFELEAGRELPIARLGKRGTHLRIR